MKQRLLEGKVIAFRAIAVSGLAGAFLFALLLSVTPQLHERIHQPSDAGHECVVTLLTAGHCQQTQCDPATVAPELPEPGAAFFHGDLLLVGTRPQFALLEHAPPVIS